MTDEESFSRLLSHKGGKVKSYIISCKRDVVKFAQERSINLATSRSRVDGGRIREWIRSINKITARALTKKRLDGDGRNQ